MSSMIDYMVMHLPTQLFGTALIGLVGWGAKSLSELSHNVHTLNIQMAAILERINSHETRITTLERKRK